MCFKKTTPRVYCTLLYGPGGPLLTKEKESIYVIAYLVTCWPE